MLGQKKNKPGVQTFFGTDLQNGSVTVFNSDSNMFTVSGSGNHDGIYSRNGNMVSESNGIHTVIGSGPVKTVLGPNGKTHTVIENGFGGTVL